MIKLILIVVSMFICFSSATVFASVNKNYLSNRILQQELSDKHFRAVLNDSINMLAIDISLNKKEQKIFNDIKPILNADQPNFDLDSF